jgi:hydroxyacylglutathione hydrolase
MWLEVFSDNPYGTNCWLLSVEGSDDALVVDPGFSPERVHAMLAAAGKKPVAVLATHGHYDHVGSADIFCAEALPFFIHEADVLALTDPERWGADLETPPVPVADVHTFVGGDPLSLAGFSLEVEHTPGHTPGSSCFLAGDFLFSGDLVFKGAIGRSDLPNSNPADMQTSLQRFLGWDDGIDVLPGHGPTTTVGEERAHNPFLVRLG